MKRSQVFQGTFTATAERRQATWVAAQVIAILLTLASTGCKEPQRAPLKAPGAPARKGIAPEYRQTLVGALTRGEVRHVYVQLKEHLDRVTRAELENRGLRLLDYLGSNTWQATVSDKQVLEFTSAAAVKRSPVLGTILWIGTIEPKDRVAPAIRDAGMAERIKTKDNRERYAVYFHRDVPMERGRRLIQEVGGRIEEEEALTRGFFVSVPPGAREALMQHDEVRLIDLYPPPNISFNDGSCAWTQSSQVHTAGFTGTGVVLGIWEAGNGWPQNQHVDLTAARSHYADVGGAVTEHATHVCGTILGTGTGTAARQGHAPGVSDIRCYTETGSSGEMSSAMQNHHIVASNNSWGATAGWHEVWNPIAGAMVWQFAPPNDFGDYRWTCPAFDELVHEDGLVIVFAAGNDRNDPGAGNVTAAQPGDWDQVTGAGSWDGYHTIPPYGTSKNVLTVGAIDDATGAMSVFSGWGPTDDGRIKPDVVAPGVSIVSCDDTDTNADGNFNHYVSLNGTSMAAPAVTGIVALLMQVYREEYLDSPASTLAPLASTIKALLCQSAQDLGPAGPDYQFGYGGVRAAAARQLILDKRFREGVMLAGSDTDIYEFNVTAGDPQIRVTLAWDDHPAGNANPDPALINDLDLLVQDPAGRYYTPWHLHVTAHDQAVNAATRNSHNVASAGLIPEADRDRWNNVEQVLIDPTLAGGPLAGGTWKVIVAAHALPETPQRYSLVANYALGGKIDVVLVLDRSGSMGGYAASGAADTKIKVLRDAATHFIDLMQPNLGNALGLVQFNQDVVAFDPAHQASLSALTNARATLLKSTTVPSVVHGGTTSIGDGLKEALSQFPVLPTDSERDQVVLLVTDGMENTPQWIADAQPNLVNRHIAVYPLGLGYSYGINEGKLTDLANATGGAYRITSDSLIFRKFFIEVLAGAVDWGVVVDPVGELGAGQEVTVPAAVALDETGATFTAYWERFDNAIDLTLISPSGTEITPAAAASGRGMRFGKHPRYAFYQLDFPLAGSLAGEWKGQWRMKLTGTSHIAAGQKARYSASAFAAGGVQLEVRVGKGVYVAGQAIPLEVRLTKDGKPWSGARINVHCDAPAVSMANVLSTDKVPWEELKKDISVHGDPTSLIDRKLQILAQQARKDILPRRKTEFRLFDDGKHRDAKARDGVYAARLTDSKIPGSYTLRIVASNIPAGAGVTTTREWTTSLCTRVGADPKYSPIDVTRLARTADGWRYRVMVVPKDRYNNYLGPGHRVSLSTSSRYGKQQLALTDHIDGTYAIEVVLPAQQLKAGVSVGIEIDGQKFADVKKPLRLP